MLTGGVALAERVVLKDGFELTGEIQTAEGQVHVRTPLQWYTFSTDQLLRTEPDLPTESAPEVYLLPNGGRKGGRRVEGLAGTNPLEPFDTFGRRRVHLKTSGDKELDVIQTMTEIHPAYIMLETLSVDWSTSLATTELSDEELLGILDQQSKGERIEYGIKIVSFLTQAGRYEQARDRLKDLRTKFPAERSRLDELEVNWKREFLAAAQSRVERMLESGQWGRASLIIQEIAPKADGDQQRAWKGFEDRLAQMESDLKKARQWIEESSEASSKEDRELAEEMVAHLNTKTIDRLGPLLALGNQEKMTPAKRWSLTASGWIAGEKLAQDDTQKTSSWIKHRDLVASAYRAPTEEGFEIALDKLRAAKVPADEVAQLLKHLPAGSDKIETEKPIRIEPNAGSAYLVLLPADYSPAGSHPLLMVLHDSGMSLEETTAFWRETAGQLNAVLVAPEYLLEEKRAYSYSLAEHEKFLATLADVRRRFAVDASRAFLAGHGIGAFAAFDLGWSHPSEWAGVIPIGGAPLFYMQYYWRNARQLPTYIVDGQLHGSNPALTRALVQQNFKRGDPVISTLFVGRGPGRFSIELRRLADWMSRQRRVTFPPVMEGTSARHGDTDFYWLSIDGFLPKSTIAPTLFDKKKGLRPARIEGKVEQGRVIEVTSAGVTGLDLKLSPALAPLGDASFEIRYQRKTVHSGPIESDIETMLREARRTGDRDRLVHRIIKLK
jgi:pimeloyl-ACP methyl ester carboxylesterase